MRVFKHLHLIMSRFLVKALGTLQCGAHIGSNEVPSNPLYCLSSSTTFYLAFLPSASLRYLSLLVSRRQY